MKEKLLDIQISGNHYKELGIQPLEVMEAILTPEEYAGFLKGNIIKYSIRQGRKPNSDDGGKANHYKNLYEEFKLRCL